tara:strand:+ start:1343 stop:1939 length:597 start_codon:yes stop_codon:yes gene_type:complete
MDTLYYSNYCKHSQRILQFLVKGNLANKINFLCIDKRQQDSNTNQIYIILEDGKRVIMPPNIKSVPSLLLVNQGYHVILGDDIIQHYQVAANLETKKKQMQMQPIEPVGTSLMQSSGGMNIISEQYTMYDLTPDELSAKGNGGRRQLHNYVSANEGIIAIQTPPDTYQPDKIDKDVTLNKLQQERINEIGQKSNNVYI